MEKASTLRSGGEDTLKSLPDSLFKIHYATAWLSVDLRQSFHLLQNLIHASHMYNYSDWHNLHEKFTWLVTTKDYMR